MACRGCSRVRRRRFIELTTIGVAAAGTTTGCREHIVDALTEDVQITLADYPELQMMGETALIELEQVDLPLAVTRVGENEYEVTGTECNHKGCEVERDGDGWKCPCHGATFALDGSLGDGPATDDLTGYDYEVDEMGIMTVFGQT